MMYRTMTQAATTQHNIYNTPIVFRLLRIMPALIYSTVSAVSFVVTFRRLAVAKEDKKPKASNAGEEHTANTNRTSAPENTFPAESAYI
jgi:hypothetical protein